MASADFLYTRLNKSETYKKIKMLKTQKSCKNRKILKNATHRVDKFSKVCYNINNRTRHA